MFENAQVAIDEIPSVGDVRWEPLAPRYALHLSLQQLVFFGVLGAVALGIATIDAFADAGPLALVRHAGFWLLFAALALTSLAWPFLAVPRKGYALRERDILYRSGVLWRKLAAVPFNRIQHVETSSGPLDRAFGLASLEIFTAGGATGDLKISGLESALATRLRSHILGQAGEARELG